MGKIKEVTKAEADRVEEQNANSLGGPKSLTLSMSMTKSVTRSIALYTKVADNMQEAVDELTETLRECGSLHPSAGNEAILNSAPTTLTHICTYACNGHTCLDGASGSFLIYM